MLNIELLKSPHAFSANTYLISSAGEYAVVDPTAPYDEGLCKGKVRYILLTHTHFDHILEIDSWVNATGAKVVIASCEVDALKDPMRNCYKLYDGSERGYFGEAEGIEDGDVLRLGETEIAYMSTPGHTAGSGIFICDGNAFVGDTVFAGGGYGRFDLPTGSYPMLLDSIRKVIRLPEETRLYPGHGPSTTIKQYKLDIGR